MLKFFCTLLIAGLLLPLTATKAREPENIDLYKLKLIRYHDSGEYNKDIAVIMQKATTYLRHWLANEQKHPHKGKLAIVLDIDETSLSNYDAIKALNFGGSSYDIHMAQEKVKTPIIPMLNFFNLAKENHIAVFFISGRLEFERNFTISNLYQAGFRRWDGLMLRSVAYTRMSVAEYKKAMRRQLIAQGYKIIMNIGDQKSDLAPHDGIKSFKMPNPFYFIP